MINGVEIKKLKPIHDDRGYLMEILRSDDEIFKRFGQVYITVAYSNVVKAWHMHKRQDDYFCVVKGNAKVVLYDSRSKSKTKGQVQEIKMGENNPILLKIPKNVYHGFTSVGKGQAYIINVPTLPYNKKNPDEFRLPFNTEKIPYNWGAKKRGG